MLARPDGRPQHPEHFSNAFERRVARYRLPRIRLHDLRPTWATPALEAGVDVKIVSKRLGHASAKITWATTSTSPRPCRPPPTVARLIFGEC